MSSENRPLNNDPYLLRIARFLFSNGDYKGLSNCIKVKVRFNKIFVLASFINISH